MTNSIPTREEAYQLLAAYTKSESLLKHALAVEAAMKYMAQKCNEDPHVWGIIGLIHDLDYEQFPELHCIKTEEILKSRHWPAEYIRAVLSHGWGLCTETEPLTLMEKCLYAVDELTGFITAAALVRPSKSVLDLTSKSVLKKWNIKAFAAGANREVIEKGSKLLNLTLDELITDVIMAMRGISKELNL